VSQTGPQPSGWPAPAPPPPAGDGVPPGGPGWGQPREPGAGRPAGPGPAAAPAPWGQPTGSPTSVAGQSAGPGPGWGLQAAPSAGPGPGPGWQRLHPLTPVVAGGRSLLVFGVIAAEELYRQPGSADTPLLIVLGAILVLMFVVNLIRYLVTRWALDGSTLRIETGLFKRDARQLPLGRIQAVDVVRPFLARTMGLAELRVRLAGGSSRASGRLAYLSEAVAVDLRARLLAGHHGLDQSTPEPVERPMAAVVNSQLVASAVLSSVSAFVVTWVVIVGIFVATSASGGAAKAGVGGTLLLSLVGLGRNTWHRVASMYGFSIGLAGDGIRIQRGLLSTVNETVPFARVQAVRKIEPLVWRLFGWCRLEVDVAGSTGDESGGRSSRVTKALLPVGRYEVADALFSNLLGLRQFPLTRPPRRAFWKSPLSYHFLSAGSDGRVVASTTGRVRKVTVWLPLEKTQSVRRVQGPVQRAFKLATVHVDAAGRRARAELRDRDVTEAATLFEQLVIDSRAARRRIAHPVGSRPVTTAPAPAPANGPAGWQPAPGPQASPAGPTPPFTPAPDWQPGDNPWASQAASPPPLTGAPSPLAHMPAPTGAPITGVPPPRWGVQEEAVPAAGPPRPGPTPEPGAAPAPEPPEQVATGQPSPPPRGPEPGAGTPTV
jgi:putative membrane protein